MDRSVNIFVPDATLYQVYEGQQELLAHGTFTTHGLPPVQGHPARTLAQVGTASWELSSNIPCLRADDLTYTFAIERHPGLYYTVILPRETPMHTLTEVRNSLSRITAYSDGYWAHQDTPTIRTPAQQPQPAGSLLQRGTTMLSTGVNKLGQLTNTGIQRTSESMSPELKAKLAKAKDSTMTSISAVGAFTNKLATVVATKVAGDSPRHATTPTYTAGYGQHPAMQQRAVAVPADGNEDWKQAGSKALNSIYYAMRDAGDVVAKAAADAATSIKNRVSTAGSDAGNNAVGQHYESGGQSTYGAYSNVAGQGVAAGMTGGYTVPDAGTGFTPAHAGTSYSPAPASTGYYQSNAAAHDMAVQKQKVTLDVADHVAQWNAKHQMQ